MSALAVVGKFFGTIFGSSKTVDNLLDKDTGLVTQVGSWIGGQQFTDQEKAEYSQAAIKGAAKFVTDTLGENTERSRTRRDIGVLWIRVQLAMVLITAMVAPLDMPLAKFYAEITFGTLMTGGTGAIIVFLFGPYMYGTHVKPQKNVE